MCATTAIAMPAYIVRTTMPWTSHSWFVNSDFQGSGTRSFCGRSVTWFTPFRARPWDAVRLGHVRAVENPPDWRRSPRADAWGRQHTGLDRQCKVILAGFTSIIRP
jgi:hypothetical protein